MKTFQEFIRPYVLGGGLGMFFTVLTVQCTATQKAAITDPIEHFQQQITEGKRIVAENQKRLQDFNAKLDDLNKKLNQIRQAVDNLPEKGE